MWECEWVSDNKRKAPNDSEGDEAPEDPQPAFVRFEEAWKAMFHKRQLAYCLPERTWKDLEDAIEYDNMPCVGKG